MFGTTNGAVHTRSVMRMDGIRRKDDVLLRFDLPGVDACFIDVTVDLGAHRERAPQREQAEGENPFIRERVTGSFVRRVRLSDTRSTPTTTIDADGTNGVLTVRLPLLAQVQPRKVEIARRQAGDRCLIPGSAEIAGPVALHRARLVC